MSKTEEVEGVPQEIAYLIGLVKREDTRGVDRRDPLRIGIIGGYRRRYRSWKSDSGTKRTGCRNLCR